MLKSLKVALIRRFARKRLGREIAPMATAATHPDYVIAYAQFSQAQDKLNLIPARLKILGHIRAAKLIECPF